MLPRPAGKRKGPPTSTKESTAVAAEPGAGEDQTNRSLFDGKSGPAMAAEGAGGRAEDEPTGRRSPKRHAGESKQKASRKEDGGPRQQRDADAQGGSNQHRDRGDQARRSDDRDRGRGGNGGGGGRGRWKDKVCKEDKRGTCNYGRNCHYSHADPYQKLSRGEREELERHRRKDKQRKDDEYEREQHLRYN